MARIIRMWLEEADQEVKRSQFPSKAKWLPLKVIYNAGSPQELVGAVSILRRWREDIYLSAKDAQP
jgi:hypothetical protein